MTGALALVAGVVLLAAGSLRLSAQMAPRSTASFLLGAYVVAWVQLVAVLWLLSLFGWVTRWALLAGLAVACVAILIDRRGWSGVAARLRDGASALRRALEDPLCAVLGVAVLLAFGYAVVLGLSTPQNDFDTIVDHLWRAAVWRENQAVGYPRCDCAPYINAYPPHGEMGVLATTVLGGTDRFAALVQGGAFVALATGVVGVARGLGLSLAITASDPGYVVLGRALRPFGFQPPDVPGATWAFVSPNAGSPSLCAAWRRLGETPSGWRVLRRPAGRC